MGKQLLIIGLTGTHNAGLAKEITDQLCKRGLSVRHASLRHGGTTTFVTGGATDLKSELAEAGISIEVVEGTAPASPAAPVIAGAVTLEVVNTNVLQVLALMSADKQPGEKKEGAGDGQTQKGRGRGGKAAPAPAPAPKLGDGLTGQPLGAGAQKVGGLDLAGQNDQPGDEPGDAQPPSTPPPGVVEETTGDEGDGSDDQDPGASGEE